MEKKLMDRMFEALSMFVFPIENSHGKRNPATLLFLTFLKKVLEEINTKIILDYFLHNWEGLQEKFSNEFDNSFFSTKIKFIYGNINQILKEKEERITEYSVNKEDNYSFVKRISWRLLLVIEESRNLQIQKSWIDADYENFIERKYFKEIKKIILPGVTKNEQGVYEANPTIESSLEFILETVKSFNYEFSRTNFQPLWADLRKDIFKCFQNEKTGYLFKTSWSSLVGEINHLLYLPMNLNGSNEKTGFYNFCYENFEDFVNNAKTLKN